MGWFWAALVPAVVSLAVLPYVIYRLTNPEIKQTPEAPGLAQKELDQMGPMSIPEKEMLGVFLFTLTLWATGQWTQMTATAIALTGVAVLVA